MSDCKNCKDCAHVVFDELWGEYKCKMRGHRIYILLDPDECKFYEEPKKKKKTNKE